VAWEIWLHVSVPVESAFLKGKKLNATTRTLTFPRSLILRRIRRIEQAAEGGTWTADAWAVERVDPYSWGRHDRLDVHASVALTEVRALLVWVAGLVETYVPSERRAAELDNLRAVTADLAGGAVQPLSSRGS